MESEPSAPAMGPAGVVARGGRTLRGFGIAIRRRFASPAAVAMLAALVVAGLGGLAPLEHALMDFRFELLQRPASGDLVVVEVDNVSLTSLGVWPWPRD